MSSTTDKDKKGRTVKIAVIVILLAAVTGAGGLYLWRALSARNAGEAAQDKDVLTFEKSDDKTPEAEEEEVVVSMIERVRELRDAYMDEEASYEEVMDEFETLKDQVEGDEAEFDEINEQIERVDKSRGSYKKAGKEYDKQRYPEAVKYYSEVIEEDEKYYKLAQEGIEACNDGVRDMIEGTWSYEYDAHVEVEQYVKNKGFDVDLSKMKIPIVFLFKLDREGSIDVSVDYDALNEYIDRIIELAVEAVGKGIQDDGIKIPGLQGMLKQVTEAAGVKEKVKKELNIQAELDRLLTESGLEKFDSYEVKDGHVYIGTACIDASVKGDELTLTSEGSAALGVGSYKMPYPIRMTRRPDKKDSVSSNKASGGDKDKAGGDKEDDKIERPGNGKPEDKTISSNKTVKDNKTDSKTDNKTDNKPENKINIKDKDMP